MLGLDQGVRLLFSQWVYLSDFSLRNSNLQLLGFWAYFQRVIQNISPYKNVPIFRCNYPRLCKPCVTISKSIDCFTCWCVGFSIGLFVWKVQAFILGTTQRFFMSKIQVKAPCNGCFHMVWKFLVFLISLPLLILPLSSSPEDRWVRHPISRALLSVSHRPCIGPVTKM